MKCTYPKRAQNNDSRKSSMRRARICGGFFAPLVSITAIASIIMVFFIRPQVEQTFEIVLETEDDYSNEIVNLESILEKANLSSFLDSDLKNGFQWVLDSKQKTQDYKADALYYTSILVYTMLGIFFVIAGFGFTMFTNSICVNKKTSIAIIVQSIFLFVLIWAISGALTSASSFVVDGCPQLEDTMAEKAGSDYSKFATYYLTCLGQNPFENINQMTFQGLQEAKNLLNETENGNSPYKNFTIVQLEKMIFNLNEVNQSISYLENCEETSGSFDDVKQKICGTMLDISAGMFLANSVSGIFAFVAVMATMIAKANIGVHTRDSIDYFLIDDHTRHPNYET